jgi:hypothetical protein
VTPLARASCRSGGRWLCHDRTDSVEDSPTHFALSVPIFQEQIAAIAEREGWQWYCCVRGAGGFHVMEVWIENTGMVELLPAAFATEYLMLTCRRAVHACAPLPLSDEFRKVISVQPITVRLGEGWRRRGQPAAGRE